MSDFVMSRRLLLGAAAGGALVKSSAVSAASQPLPLSSGPLSITDFGARPGEGDASPAFNAAFAQLSSNRISPPGYRDWGLGAIDVPRGNWLHRTPISFVHSQAGFTLRGAAAYATNHVFDISRGAAIPLKAYVAITLTDFLLKNVAADPGSSVGISMEPNDGGGLVAIKRVVIDGFDTAIKLSGDANGDKTLLEQVSFGGRVGFDQGQNEMAIGWTFLNGASECKQTHFLLGGAGELLIANYTSNILGSLIELPEASGGSGSGPRNYFGSRITVMSTKLEYHGDGDRMLIDARASRLLTDLGGSNCDLVLREVSLASGSAWPDTSRHVVIQVGDETGGSDAIRLKQEGGWIEGVIRLGSVQFGPLNRRWSFRDAVRAPNPATVDFVGPGSHYLMEWRANENVPVDQYRGGQAFTGSIDAQKAYLWRHVGPALLNAGVEDGQRDIAGRKGGSFAIGGFPAGTAQTGLAVYLDQALPPGIDLEVTQYADGRFATPVGRTLALPSGTVKGLHKVHDEWRNLGDGTVYVRVTANVARIAVRGAIVPLYFPYMGT